MRTVTAVVTLVSLAACATFPAQDDTPDADEMLRTSLPVAAAALAAGQLDVARRLYLSLSERFEDAPEPLLGLGYIAFQIGDLPDAEHNFLQAAERASDMPALRAEALLGAGRTALVRDRPYTARRHLRDAQTAGQNTPSSPWIANGLAVIETLDSDYDQAETYFAEAFRHSPTHPRIVGNYVRMLVAAGRIDDAFRTFAEHPPTFWADDDGPALSRLIDESHGGRLQAPASRRSGAPASTQTGFAAHAGTTPEVPDVESRPRHPASSLALRLYEPSPAPVQPRSDARLAGDATPPDPASLALRLDRWPDRRVSLPMAGKPVPSPVASDGARSHPLAEHGAPAVAVVGHPTGPTLAIVLGQSRRLHLEHDASSVLVASPEIADVQLLAPDVVYVIGKSVGRTSVAVLDDNEQVDEWVVSVALDLDPLRAVLAGEPSLAGVRAQRLTRGVALTGEVASAEAADRALRLAAAALPEGMPVENELRVAAPQQVNLEVQIAEVQRSVTEDLGVNWESFGIANSTRFGFRIGQFPLTEEGSIPGRGGFPFRVIGADVASSVVLATEGSRGQFGAMIDALATAGLATVLARPNVTAISGESASFFSGGEFPLPTGFDDGVLVFSYKKYGVLLDFVPTVVDSGRIVLTVRPEVSEPSLNESISVVQGVDVPVINVRRAETTVEVADGESIVIAGLFRNQSNTVESGVPVVKDLPLLGALFGRTSARSNELELIVVVTARLVEPYTDPGDAGEPPATLQVNGYHY